MVALESPNSWLRRGNAEQASGTAKVAHPGGVISSNKTAATAAFLRRRGSGAGAGAGLSASSPPTIEPLSPVPAETSTALVTQRSRWPRLSPLSRRLSSMPWSPA
jgi:hypothetical protein